jgi:hypothetical protein
MLFFGHVGITLGVATLITGLTRRRSPTLEHKVSKDIDNTTEPVPRLTGRLNQNTKIRLPTLYLVEVSGKLRDIRWLIIGLLLPDIIDKPAGLLFFKSTFYNGRIFSHLLFLFIILLAGLYLYQNRKQIWLIVLATGTSLTSFWMRCGDPPTLLWPIYGGSSQRM